MKKDQARPPSAFRWLYTAIIITCFVAITFTVYLWLQIPPEDVEGRKPLVILFAIAGAVIVGVAVRLRRMIRPYTSSMLWTTSVIGLGMETVDFGAAWLLDIPTPISDLVLKIIVISGSLVVFAAFYPIVFPNIPFRDFVKSNAFSVLTVAALVVSFVANLQGFSALYLSQDERLETLIGPTVLSLIGDVAMILIFWVWGRYVPGVVVTIFFAIAGLFGMISGVGLLNFNGGWISRHPLNLLISEMTDFAAFAVIFQQTYVLLFRKEKPKPKLDIGRKI